MNLEMFPDRTSALGWNTKVKHANRLRQKVTEGGGCPRGVRICGVTQRRSRLIYPRRAFIIYRNSPLRGNFLSEQDLLGTSGMIDCICGNMIKVTSQSVAERALSTFEIEIQRQRHQRY